MNSFPPPTGPPVENPHRRHTGRIVLVLTAAVVAIGALAVSAFSSDSDDSDEPAAADGGDRAPTAIPEPSPAPPTDGEPEASDGDIMPDVMCMNLQDAQDRIQEAGVFFSRSDDATGEGRNQILDSNWQVVGQTPVPGTPIGEFEAVLDVVKYGEPSPC
jgi:hypothetical protein